MQTADATRTLAELAVTLPAASRVFHRHRLDYCCHGQRPLADACAERGLAPAKILEAIAAEATLPEDARWDDRPIDSLLKRIVEHYHARLRVELPGLIEMADKVERVHAGKESVPRGLAAHLAAIEAEVTQHLAKEETILFPMIAGGSGRRATGPIHMMEMEHTDHARALARTRELAANFVPPDEACTTWRALYLRLAAFEAEFMEHIHLENNVLFPRALCG